MERIGKCEKVAPRNTMDESEYKVAVRPRDNPQIIKPIAGVPVRFPVKPYPSQLSLMDKIIQGLKRRQNCLLESPTGSGKSLAILCSTLAWQQQQIARAKRYNALIDNGITDLDVLAEEADFNSLTPRPIPGAPLEPPTPTPTATPTDPASHPLASSAGFFYDDDDFRTQPPAANLLPADDTQQTQPDLASQYTDYDFKSNKPKKIQVPKIFLGTRTHKQVAQLVKELRRTYYSDVNMVVLSSREHTCIHPEVSSSSNKNELCQEYINPIEDGKLCHYHLGVHRIKDHNFIAKQGGLEGAWDIEDLVKVGHKLHVCPYFTARKLLDTADLVICPYNYLVDPIVRKSMDITLRNHVLVMDEAHNIEDSARDAASTTINQEEMMDSYSDLRKQTISVEECEELANMLAALSSWIDDNKDNLTDFTDFERSGKVFTGIQFIAVLKHLNLGYQNWMKLQQTFSDLSDSNHSEHSTLALSSVTKAVLERFFLMFQFLFKRNMQYADDYRIAIVKEQVRRKPHQKSGEWVSRKTALELVYRIDFMCLNPAVIFDSISSHTHSIILTSGTLSPMNSFQSELDVLFKIKFEANHVINKNQTFIATVGHGPRNTPLLATYKNTSSWEFQDQIGEVVLKVCQTVPGGILCFLPSYSLMDKLHERWMSTGLWDEIAKIKKTMTEKRKGEEFERDMVDFYATIRNTKYGMKGDTITGVFFLAVYRGKVSEGLDLTDDNARAIIAVGIPFPNVKDIQVDLKKKYNNVNQQSRNLLSGQEWYEIQAYRALNQALGRCIRHCYDWGALLLVDLRFHQGRAGHQQNNHIRHLSKWVRNKVTWQPNFSETMYCLREFVENMIANPPQRPITHDEILSTRTLQPSAKEKVETSSSGKYDTSCHEVIEIPQTDRGNPMKFFQNVKNISHDQIECKTSESIKIIHSQSENSGQRYGSPSRKSTKESEKISTESKKRLFNAMDFQDMDDFNLTLSPAAPVAHQPPNLVLKRVRKKKGVFFCETD